MQAILGKKLKMSQIWKGDKVIPVTIVEAKPNQVSAVRTQDKNGYEAIQLMLGKAKREFKLSADLKIGDSIDVSVLNEGDKIVVSGTSKGRGFQGVVKRHGFAGGPKTRGQKNRHRAPGSIGSTAPQRVFPGRRMAGHMGSERITLKNIEVVQIDKEKNQLFLKGAVPGAIGSLVEIRTMAVAKAKKK
ncbi:MAG: 50S ribosomal protein L3 [Patescibacteria group bacterium]